MVEALVSEFEVSKETAIEDIETFTKKLQQANILEEII
jgi:hypothetical protein